MTRARTIVLVGTGAFVTEDAYGPGVIARSLAQWCRDQGEGNSFRLVVLTRSREGCDRFTQTWHTIQSELGTAPPLELVDASSPVAQQEIRNAHALFICVPDEAHADYLEMGLAGAIPTWIVKPLTGKGLSSSSLAEAADQRGVPVWVDYHKRFDVSNRMLRSTLSRGELGAPLLYSVRYSQPRDLPLNHFTWANRTDVFSYIGCHYVDQLMFVLPGIEVRGVTARGIPGPVHNELGGQAWDTVLARLDAEWRGRPVTAQFEVGWGNPLASPTKSLQVVEMTCERGKLFLDQTRRGFEIWSDDAVSTPNPYFFSRVHDPVLGEDAYQGYGYDSIRHFLDFTLASAEQQARALENDALPWARSAARVDLILDRVREAVAGSASASLSSKDSAGPSHARLSEGAIEPR